MRIKFTDGKSEHVQKLYSDMLDILVAVGIPVGELTTDRRREKMAGACLAAGQIVESFKEAKSVMNGSFLTTRRIIEFENEHYGEQISSGSYDDIRRKDLKLLVDEGYVVNSSVLDQSATNNPNRGYTLSAPFANLIKVYGTSKWEKQLAYFIDVHQKAKEELERKRAMERIPVTLPSGVTLELSTGEHNLLQKKIVEDFLPLFGMGAEVLYIGDSTDKYLNRDTEALQQLHITLEHGTLPDIVAYSREKNLLFLIEAYHSSNPMNVERVSTLKQLVVDSGANVVFVTAFLNKLEGLKHLKEIAWETEVWFANEPEHMIHLNGCKFLKVYNSEES
jgi:type II restriction enzyme